MVFQGALLLDVRVVPETFVDGWKFDPFFGGGKQCGPMFRSVFLLILNFKALRVTVRSFDFWWRMFGWGRPGPWG